ncbi:hypothetical protein A8C56_14280 [Niabella ginsenosidivorans]|uniref:Uncharacterized protein n=2 Tax=Niabella ginsenosidivorans TaxID=1176587 RepID=A0A1A9I5N3_9BACT|nr:hypothetical protein A8C56_14280 [Niabella ginsenosidivorans]
MCSLLLAGLTVPAQVFSDQLLFLQSQTQFMTIQSNIYSNMAMENLERDNRNRNLSETASSTPKRSAASGDFLFTPQGQVSASVRQSIIDNLKRKNPVPGRELEKALTRDNPFPAYVKYLKAAGLDVQHNYADAFAAYMLGMWRIANGRSADPAAWQIKAAQAQTAMNLDMRGWSARKKQEAAEYMIYDLIFANEPYEASRKGGNKKQMQADSDAVYERFLRQNRLDLRKIQITEAGLTRMR